MTIVQSIETIRDWLEANVCSLVELKLPDDNAAAETYPYKLVKPAAFSLFVPGKDRLPQSVAPIPSVCVQLLEGSDSLLESKGRLRVRLVFSAWNPGQHGPTPSRRPPVSTSMSSRPRLPARSHTAAPERVALPATPTAGGMLGALWTSPSGSWRTPSI